MHEYIDAHNHLQDVLLTHDLDKALTAVRSLPVRWMVVNGTTETDWAIVHRLAKDLPFVIPSYGLHPWYLRQYLADRAALPMRVNSAQSIKAGGAGLAP